MNRGLNSGRSLPVPPQSCELAGGRDSTARQDEPQLCPKVLAAEVGGTAIFQTIYHTPRRGCSTPASQSGAAQHQTQSHRNVFTAHPGPSAAATQTCHLHDTTSSAQPVP